LLYAQDKVVEIAPTPLNRGEKQFVEDMKKYHDAAPAFFAGKQLFLLRNLSRGRGIGFFEAGNFYPDFILWLLVEGTQHVIFVDPKGIRNLGPTDPKIEFHKTIKQIETRLGDPTVKLHSFIVSNTAAETMTMLWRISSEAMQARHIVFQEDENYLAHLLQMALADVGA
jgi:hypothetical protein